MLPVSIAAMLTGIQIVAKEGSWGGLDLAVSDVAARGPGLLQVLASVGEEEGGATTCYHTRRPPSIHC